MTVRSFSEMAAAGIAAEVLGGRNGCEDRSLSTRGDRSACAATLTQRTTVAKAVSVAKSAAIITIAEARAVAVALAVAKETTVGSAAGSATRSAAGSATCTPAVAAMKAAEESACL